ncbi:MAG: cobalamin-binding protein [Pseudomonadota bacterium]
MALAATPARVVTLAPHLAELVCAAGACDRLVAVGEFTDYPEQAAKLPKIADAHGVNAEALLAQKPDLVLVWDGGTPQSALDALAKLSVPVRSLKVRRLDEIATAIEQIGDWLGTAPVAKAAAQEFRAGLSRLAARYAQSRKLRVMYQIENNPIYSVNRLSPISQAINVCGGINVFGELPQLAAPVSREAVMAENPDVIVFARQDKVADILDDWSRWQELKAVRENHLFSVNADLLARAAPRMLQGIEELCGVLDMARIRP